MLRFAFVWMIAFVFVLITGTSRAHAAEGSENDPAVLLKRIKTLTENLDLTADQKQPIETLFRKAADDLQSASQDMQSASPEEKTTQFRNLLAGLRQQLGQLLSDDQKAELQQKLQALRGSTTTPSSNRNSSPAANPPGAGLRQGGFGRNGGPPGRGGPARGGQLLQRLKSSIDQVGLSAEQQTQVDDLFKSLQQQIQTLRSSLQSGTVDRQSFREQVRSIFESARSKLPDILTQEQLAKVRQSMMQSADATGGRPGGALQGGPRGGPPSGALGGPPGGFQRGTVFGNGPLPSSPAQSPPATPAPAVAPEKPAAPAQPAPAVGQQAPDFSLKLLNGETAALASYNHKLLVLVLGSYTNPSLRDRAAGLEALRDQFGTRGVNFLIIYTRETHPTDGWEIERNKTDDISITQPATEADRKTTAEHAKEAMKLSIPMATDTMDNKTDTAYAVGDSTPAYLIGRDGKILFHQSWLEPMALGQAVQDALKP